MKINSTNIQNFTDVQRQFEYLKFELEKKKFIKEQNDFIDGIVNTVWTPSPNIKIKIPKDGEYKILLNCIASLTTSSDPTYASFNYNVFKNDNGGTDITNMLITEYHWVVPVVKASNNLFRGEASKNKIIILNKGDILTVKFQISVTGGTVTSRDIKIANIIVEEI